MKTQLVFLAAILAVAFATSIDLNNKVCKEFCAEIKQARGWNKLGKAAADEQIKLYIAVSLQNTDRLDEIFWTVSDPLHEKYGQHWSFDQLHELVAPSESTMEKLFSWLDASPARNEMTDITVPHSGDYIIIDISVEGAETLLSTEFYNYEHATTGMKLIRSPGPYYVPAAVNEDIDFIGGVVRFPRHNHVKRVRQSERQQGGVDPIYIKQAFNVPANLKGQSSNNSQAVAQFAVYQQYFSPSDLTSFQQNYNLQQQQPTVYGANQASNPGDEDMLDVEYIMGVAQNIPTWVVITNGSANGGQEPFIDWITGQKNNKNSPWVHSVSYGDDENSVSLSYADRLNAEFKIFGSAGRSIFFASGDDGVGCSNDGNSFVPNFPSGLPTVTAVGGIYTNDMGRFAVNAERQSNQFIGDEISSGGFSNYFNMPTYQKAAVKNFISSQNSSVLPPSSYFNASGRAYPDIASFSENVNIVVGGGWEIVGGTSCASPVVAAIFALVNDARLQKGKSTIGFANPLIYHLLATNVGAFYDVTVGGPNGGCGNANGFYAAPGWDPVTGVGCPNFGNLVKYATEI